MSTPHLVVLIVAGWTAVAIALALGYALIRPAMWRFRPARSRTGLEAYRVRTPLGTAAVTRVLHPDRGDSYLITTPFHPDPVYVAPSLMVARDRIVALCQEHAPIAQEAPR